MALFGGLFLFVPDFHPSLVECNMKSLYSQAKSMLPKWARGLASETTTVVGIRTAVRTEIKECHRGENPLSPDQYKALTDYLVKTDNLEMRELRNSLQAGIR